MPLILGSTPHSDWQSIVPLLERTGLQPEYSADTETWYQTGLEEANGSKRYLLIHSRPEIAVARALAGGEEPDQALNQWLIAAQAMVSFFRHHRRQSVMVDLAHLQAEPKTMLEAVCSCLNLGSEQLMVGESEEALKTTEVQPLDLLLATQLVRQNPQVETLLAQIEACSVPLEGQPYAAPSVDVASILKEWKARVSNAKFVEQLRQELELRKEEIQSLSSRLELESAEKQTVRAEIAQQAEKLKAAQSDTQRLQQEIDHLLQAVAGQKEEVAGAGNENSLLLEQLHLIQEELEKQFKQLSVANLALEESRQNERYMAEVKEGLERELDKRANRISDLEKQLGKVQQELRSLAALQEKDKAEKLAAKEELSTLAKELARVQNNEQRLHTEKDQLQQLVTELNEQLAGLKNVGAENHLLLEQLHLVQEELERQFLQKKQLQKQLDDNRKNQDHALEVANREIRRLQDQLNSFQSSKAWKATAPIRAIGKPFRRGSPEIKSLKRQITLVKRSGLFNSDWYLTKYPDVATAEMDPIEHYLKFGAQEGRNPSPEFDTNWYLSSYPDVAQHGMNPLVHYIKFGRNEQRAPHAHYFPTLPAPQGDR